MIDEGFFYLIRPLLLGEAPQPLLNPPLFRSGGLKAWPAGPVLANKLSPLRGCSWSLTQQSCDCQSAFGAPAEEVVCGMQLNRATYAIYYNNIIYKYMSI